MIILSILVIVTLYTFVIVYRKKQFADEMRYHFKSPPIDPLVGHVLRIPRTSHGVFDTFNGPNGWFKKYGKNCALVLPLYKVIIALTRPEDIEKILANSNSKSARKGDAYMFLEPWLGTGLLISWGEKWFQRRKIITPTFHFNILESFAEVMSKQSDIFVDKLRPYVGKGDVDIYQPTTLFALDVICETSMGITVDAQLSPSSKYVQAVKEMASLFQERFFSVFGQWQFLYDLTPNGNREKKLRKILHEFTDRVITQRRDQLLNGQTTDGRKNFLDMLLSSSINGKPLSNADIREEVDTFMFEGHDTTTSGIAFTLYQLSKHKDIQDRLYEELADTFGDVDSMKITMKSIADLRYLDMVVKEGLRIMPSVPFIVRRLTEDTVLDGVTIPTGTNLSINIYGIHHDPDNFPDPEKFDPERFAPDQTTSRHPFAYIPFSAGARNCIGQKFALTEMKLVIAKLLMNYELLPAVDQKSFNLQGDIVLKSSEGICLRIIKRTNVEEQVSCSLNDKNM